MASVDGRQAKVRAATPEDVPAVLPMVAKICEFHEHADPARFPFVRQVGLRYEKWLTAQALAADGVFLVAEVGQTLAGFLVGTMEHEAPVYRVQRYGFIHDLWVDEAHRGAGIARQLVLTAIGRFEQAGAEQIRLDTAASNDAARRLFASCGFRPSIVEMLIVLDTLRA